ncbi:MAG TPA: recombinase RecA [Gemmataceae bacterium]|nr:recombinase RecA [Gemmataceae bacterium]
MADQASDRDLKNALSAIEKQFGKGAIMQLGENAIQDIPGISTGSLSLDLALGGKGLPRGRIVEIYGPESSGKTTVALHAVANAQRKGGVAAFIDAEHALDPAWAKRLGVDLEGLLVSQPSSGEEALKIVELLVSSKAVDVIVVDSVAALVPKAELDGEIGDAHVGLLARLMSQALRMLNPTVARTQTCLIFINQIRQKIGTMGYGDPNTTTGGLALKFYSSVRMDIRRIGDVKDGEEKIGSRTKVKVVKNKVAAPFRQTEFDLMYDRGISREGDVLDMAIEDRFVDKSGTWLSYGDVRLGQGREKAKDYLRENPDLLKEIERKVIEKRSPNVAATLTATNGEMPEAKPEKPEKPEKAEKEPTTRSRRQATAASE